MSDEVNVVEQEVEQTQEKPSINKDSNQELRNSLNEELDKKLEGIKAFYEEKLEVKNKEIKGLDRKVSELTKVNRKYETEKLTEEERFQLEKKELQEQYQSLWRDKAIAQNGLIPDEDEVISFSDYLYGENAEEIYEKATRLKEFIENRIKKGIEKGVQERFAAGYKPKSQSGQDSKDIDLSEMTADELSEKAKQVSAMTDGPEKSRLLKELMNAQMKRTTRR